MATFKLVVSDPKTGKSKFHEIKEDKARSLVGRKIGEEIEGELLGISGVVLRITGGSDKDGFPMRPEIHGGVRKKILLRKGVGFKPKRKGERRRKTIRGNTVTEDIVQINMVKQPRKVKPTTTKQVEQKPKETTEVKEAKDDKITKPKPKEKKPKTTKKTTKQKVKKPPTKGKGE
jgi:small subunit ribosomal protein S6e